MKDLKEYLGKEVEVIIDRPLGTKHPKHNIFYPVNYGYISNTISGDGKEIDAYVLGEFKAINKYNGVVIGIIVREDDNEDKLVVADTITRYSEEQIKALTEFQEKYFKIKIYCYDYLKPSIRVTSKAIIRKNDSVLLLEELNTIPRNNYFRLPGGGVHFQELTNNAIEREIKEELCTQITRKKFIKVIENLFEINGIKAHELCFLYEINVNEEFYINDSIDVTEGIIQTKAYWIERNRIKDTDFRLYPEILKEYI